MKETPVLTLIQQIKARQTDPKVLTAEDRQRCVEVLVAEGWTAAEVGQVLGRSERTIRRDLEQIREANAVSRDPAMVERVVGDMIRQAEAGIARLRRIAREQGASAMERLMAEQAAWKVMKEFVEVLQSVGYLPRVPTSVVADIYQRVEADPIAGYKDLGRRIEELKSLSDSPDIAKKLELLHDEARRGELAAHVEQVSSQVARGAE